MAKMANIYRLLNSAAYTSLLFGYLAGCAGCNRAKSDPPLVSAAAKPPQIPEADTPPPEATSGFDGKRAFEHVARLVAFGPRPSGSHAIAEAQDYITTQLTTYGCTVETDPFFAQTPAGRMPMKNILVKVNGEKPGIIVLGTHYDTKKLDNFVGADDGGSSTGVMLELARLLCAKPGPYAIWIAFFDGEEAVQQWTDTDSRYGSRQMAAKLAMSGDLAKIKAFLLADMVGSRLLRFKRDTNSTPALVDLVWKTAARLGYDKIFVNEAIAVEDDHLPFLKRGVPSVDVINMDIMSTYWHTPQDTLDKISAKSLAITGHVFMESVNQLQSK
jgi:Zn-dependent M28 family amino/carboxypeptidase